MSSEITGNWPTEASLNIHREMFEESARYLEENMLTPQDKRLIIGLGVLSIAGLDAAVLAIGEAGHGKTRFGNIDMGSDSRVELQNNNTEETLFGFPNPTEAEERIAGKIIVDPNDPRFYMNEVSHLRNTGPLHRMWDDNVVRVGDQFIPVTNASIYATSNFPDSRRVNDLDGAMRSRFGVEILFGDVPKEVASQLADRGVSRPRPEGGIMESGIIPNAKAREDLRRRVNEGYGLYDGKLGGYMVEVMDRINKNPLFNDVSLGDARMHQSWYQTIGALKFVSGHEAGSRATVEDASKVAALVLPTLVTLSGAGKNALRSRLGGLPKLDPVTEAVALRRAIAGLAYNEVLNGDVYSRGNENDKQAKFRDRFSFAGDKDNDGRIDEFVEEALFGGKRRVEQTQPDEPATRRSVWSFRRNR